MAFPVCVNTIATSLARFCSWLESGCVCHTVQSCSVQQPALHASAWRRVLHRSCNLSVAPSSGIFISESCKRAHAAPANCESALLVRKTLHRFIAQCHAVSGNSQMQDLYHAPASLPKSYLGLSAILSLAGTHTYVTGYTHKLQATATPTT